MKQYHELLIAVKERGTYKEAAREGMPGTTSLFGYQSRYDLREGFPIVTTKKMFWKGIVAELLWFLRGDTNIKYLDEQGVTKMWHEDAYNFYLTNFKNRVIYGTDAEVKMKQAEEPMSFEAFCQLIRETPRAELPTVDVHGGKYTFGDCGFQYGKVWRAWPTGKSLVIGHNGNHNEWGYEIVDQIRNIVNSIKSGPYGRRHLVTAIDPAHDKELALYWCHALFQFNCRKISLSQRVYDAGLAERFPILAGEAIKEAEKAVDDLNVPKYYLDCQLYQRSCDVLLGVPFNISSYALLTHVIAKVVNMVPGEFIHTYGDVHIYDNHMDAVNEQLERDYNKYKLPHLHISDKVDPNKAPSWDHIRQTLDFSSLTVSDFTLIGYESYPKLESDTSLSTGMKK